MNYQKAEKFVLERLRSELPADVFYHGPQHTIDAIAAATEFALAEGVSGDDLVIIKTAALYHDVGFIYSHTDNERLGVKMARDTLGLFGYKRREVDIIGNIIMATVYPYNPETLFEKIICDADLEYLGTGRFYEYSELLRLEIEVQGKKFTEAEWLDFEIEFLKNHTFFTQSCIETRGPLKQKHLEELLQKRKDLN
jgi:predicted metal-dependent HD superfamily phosphohydrolase